MSFVEKIFLSLHSVAGISFIQIQSGVSLRKRQMKRKINLIFICAQHTADGSQLYAQFTA